MTMWLLHNIDTLLITTVVLAFVGYLVYTYLTAPSEKRKSMIYSWLLQAVVEAEKIFKSKSGSLKFSYVYDAYLQRFPLISRFLPKAIFMELVNEALVEMRKLLEHNKSVKDYIEGDE